MGGAATLVVVVFLLLWLLIGALVPPMMTWLVQAEHQSYLARANQIGSNIIPLLGQTPALLLASQPAQPPRVHLGRQWR